MMIMVHTLRKQRSFSKVKCSKKIWNLDKYKIADHASLIQQIHKQPLTSENNKYINNL